VTLEDGHPWGLLYAVFEDGKVISGYQREDGKFLVNGIGGRQSWPRDPELTVEERTAVELALQERESGQGEVEPVSEAELKLMKEFREFVERKIEALMASSTFPLGVG
jgi:hypothetical protein